MMMRNGQAINGSIVEDNNVELAQNALKEIVAQKQKAIEAIEDQLNVFYAKLRRFKSEAFLQLKNSATAKYSMVAELHQQELAIKTKLEQIRHELRQEEMLLEQQKQAYSTELALILTQSEAKLKNLKQLKQELAKVIREEIKSLKSIALSEKKLGKVSKDANYLNFKSVKEFNAQFRGFAEITAGGNLVFQDILKNDFSSEPLEIVQQAVVRLLKQSNSDLIGKSFALKQLIAGIDGLAKKEDFRALVSSEVSEQPYMNGDVHFAWAGPVQKLQAEVSSPAIVSQLSKLPAKHFAVSSLDALNAEVAGVKVALQDFRAANLEFEKQEETAKKFSSLFGDDEAASSLFISPNETALLNQTKAKVLGEFDKFNDGVLSSYYVHKLYDQVEAGQVEAIFKGVSKLRVNLADVGTTMPRGAMSEKEKQLFSKNGMDLYVEAARSSYQLLDTVQKIKIAYQGEALPVALSEQISHAFQEQAGMVEALVIDDELEEKYPDEHEVNANDLFSQVKEKNYFVSELEEQVAEVKAGVTALSAEDIQASRFCGLVMDTLRNAAYWNEQLTFSSVRKTLKAPTGVDAMKKTMDSFYENHGAGWVHNPVLAKQFLAKIQEEAKGRLAYKVLGFFNPGRDVHTAQFYKFLAQLDVNKLTSETFLAAKKVHSIESTIAAKNVERAQEQALAI